MPDSNKIDVNRSRFTEGYQAKPVQPDKNQAGYGARPNVNPPKPPTTGSGVKPAAPKK